MLFAYLLQASVLVMSAVLGVSSNPTSEQMTYVKEDQTVIQSDKTVQIMAVDDRSSNLKYVMAILSSSIWSEIKKRSLTINTQHRLNGTAAEKSLDDLSDQELSQLKKACHDGLKCVAVDQLLVLKTVEERLGDGKVSVRTAITKITQVLTQYTTEYHEDVYQYEAVTQFDDQSKVYESVTTIVEDNRELCKIDVTPAKEENRPKKRHGNIDPVNHDGAVNYNTVNNYNINNGTVNNATINIEPHSDRTVGGDRPKSETPKIHIRLRIAPDDGPTSNETPKNDSQRKRPRQNYAQKSGTPDRHYEPVANTDNHTKYAGSTDNHRNPVDQQLMITDGPSPRDSAGSGNGYSADTAAGTGNRGRGRKALRSSPDQPDSANAYEPATKNIIVSNRSNDHSGNDASKRTVSDKGADNVNNNTVELNNSSGGNGCGENDSDSDIVSAGSHNKHDSRKGLVEDGYLNNGNMKVESYDKSNRNKGTIKNSNAKNGIINVGTINNGPVNYGTSTGYTNNGNVSDMNSYAVQQYVSSIDKMYTKILNELAKK